MLHFQNIGPQLIQIWQLFLWTSLQEIFGTQISCRPSQVLSSKLNMKISFICWRKLLVDKVVIHAVPLKLNLTLFEFVLPLKIMYYIFHRGVSLQLDQLVSIPLVKGIFQP